MLSFGPSRWRWLVEGASQEEIEIAFADWEMLASEPANTASLGWPMNKKGSCGSGTRCGGRCGRSA
jgi:hypothetical protein